MNLKVLIIACSTIVCLTDGYYVTRPSLSSSNLFSNNNRKRIAIDVDEPINTLKPPTSSFGLLAKIPSPVLQTISFVTSLFLGFEFLKIFFGFLPALVILGTLKALADKLRRNQDEFDPRTLVDQSFLETPMADSSYWSSQAVQDFYPEKTYIETVLVEDESPLVFGSDDGHFHELNQRLNKFKRSQPILKNRLNQVRESISSILSNSSGLDRELQSIRSRVTVHHNKQALLKNKHSNSGFVFTVHAWKIPDILSGPTSIHPRNSCFVTTILLFVLSGIVSAQTSTITFSYSGSVQSFTVPVGVTSLNVDIRGAKGGSISTLLGGYGGCLLTSITVTPNSVLNIVVGQAGADTESVQTAVYGGGGIAGSSLGTQGGGASYISLNTGELLVVAGGGGGCYSACSGVGGQGGGLIGGSSGSGCVVAAYTVAGGGTSSAGGVGATYNSVNVASNGASLMGGNGYACGGGGGGGYFGGGGGCWCGGGGGSSYTNPTYCYGTPTHTQGCNAGSGTVTITYTIPQPTLYPSLAPISNPTLTPISNPTLTPISNPTPSPTSLPTPSPSCIPTLSPTSNPTSQPTPFPTPSPSSNPTPSPTSLPTPSPSCIPTPSPTSNPTPQPTPFPTPSPSSNPTPSPTSLPTPSPS
eukprot:gene11769-15751_t